MPDPTKPAKVYHPDGSWSYEDPEIPSDEEWCEEYGVLPDTINTESETHMIGRITPITDDRGKMLLPAEERYEPLPGSVVLTEGVHGTAWQRFFSDGKWHPTRGGGSKTWSEMLTRRNLVLVYDAAERRYPS